MKKKKLVSIETEIRRLKQFEIYRGEGNLLIDPHELGNPITFFFD